MVAITESCISSGGIASHDQQVQLKLSPGRVKFDTKSENPKSKSSSNPEMIKSESQVKSMSSRLKFS